MAHYLVEYLEVAISYYFIRKVELSLLIVGLKEIWPEWPEGLKLSCRYRRKHRVIITKVTRERERQPESSIWNESIWK